MIWPRPDHSCSDRTQVNSEGITKHLAGSVQLWRFVTHQHQLTHCNSPYLLLNLPRLHNDLLCGTVTVGCVLLHSASDPTLTKAQRSLCTWQEKRKKKPTWLLSQSLKVVVSYSSQKAKHLLMWRWCLAHTQINSHGLTADLPLW